LQLLPQTLTLDQQPRTPTLTQRLSATYAEILRIHFDACFTVPFCDSGASALHREKPKGALLRAFDLTPENPHLKPS
jgi:hypothetical protein